MAHRPLCKSLIKKRYFIALTVSWQSDIPLESLGFVDGLDWFWLEPKDWHITLKFLGPCSVEEQKLALSRLNAISQDQVPKHLTTEQVCSYRDRYWVIKLQRSDALEGLKLTVDEVFQTWPQQDGRAFVPHITLARGQHCAHRYPISIRKTLACRNLVLMASNSTYPGRYEIMTGD